MNKGLPDTLSASFPNTIPVPRPLVVDQQIKDPNWLAGFVDADGSLIISVVREPLNRVGYSIGLRFSVVQHSRDVELMKNLVEYLGCGSLVHSKKSSVEFVVTRFADIQDKIIPFFITSPLHGVKALNYADFCRVAILMKDKAHLTEEGLEQILKIKVGMNKGRVNF
jgi:hypothetical protein